MHQGIERQRRRRSNSLQTGGERLKDGMPSDYLRPPRDPTITFKSQTVKCQGQAIQTD